MSNKTTTMQKDGKTELTPKLRFPEFRDKAGWEVGRLENALFSLSNGLNLEQGSDTSGYRVTRIETISSGTIDLEKVGFVKTPHDLSAYKLRVGDILLSNINSLVHIGKSVFVDQDYNLYHGMNLLRLVVNKSKNNPKFIFHIINTSEVRASFRERANKAVNQASINQTELGKTQLALPLLREQQKIADCLTSLDELIAAQSQKLDALKTHKKGLMQQLFPHEGETVPSFRFPEFRDAPKWNLGTLYNACQMQAGRFVSASEIRDKPEEGRFPCYGGNGIRGYTETFTHTGKYPLIGRQGALCGNVKFGAGQFHATEHAIVVTPKNIINVEWLFYALDFLDLNRFATGQAQPGLSVDVLAKVPLALPEQQLEQRKIADCLTSVDELIAAQSQKLDALKTHKKGLMQQLFPSPEELES